MGIEKLLNDGLDDVAQRIQKLKEKALSHVGQNAGSLATVATVATLVMPWCACAEGIR